MFKNNFFLLCLLCISLLSASYAIFLPNLQQEQAQQIDECQICENDQIIKGVNFLGISSNIMLADPTSSILSGPGFSSIFLLCCGNDTLVDSYGNILPEGILKNPIYQTEEQFNPQVAYNISQYQTTYTSNIQIRSPIRRNYNRRSWFRFQNRYRGQQTQQIKKLQDNFQLQEQIYSKISINIKNYQLSIGDMSMMYLNQETVNKIQQLPINYTTQEDQLSYLNFLHDVGTHFQKSVTLGGMIVQEVKGNYSYQPVNDKSLIFNNLNFSNQTINMKREVVGGQPGTSDDFQLWSQTLEMYPGTVEQQFLPISDILQAKNVQNIPNISQIQANLEQAIDDFFNYDGCTDPLAINYNSTAVDDDGSCYYEYYQGFYITTQQENCPQQYQIFQKNQKTFDFSCPYQSKPVLYASHKYYTPNEPQNTGCSNPRSNQFCQMNIYLCSSQTLQTNLSGYSVCDSQSTFYSASGFNQVNSITQSTSCPENTIDITMGTFTSYGVLQNGQASCGTQFQYVDVYCYDHLCIPQQYQQITNAYVFENYYQPCPNGTRYEPFYSYNVSSIEYQQAAFCMFQP